MPETRIEFSNGPGGWLQAFVRLAEGYRQPEPHDTVWLRLWRNEAGSWQPTGEFYLPGITQEGLRLVPLRRILLAVGADDALGSLLASKIEEPVPKIGSVDFLKAFSGYVRPELDLHLERPKGRYLSDEFYSTVAAAYRSAVERGLKPRKAIADAAGVSTDVAGRWVRQARKRHLLPETEPGKVRA